MGYQLKYLDDISLEDSLKLDAMVIPQCDDNEDDFNASDISTTESTDETIKRMEKEMVIPIYQLSENEHSNYLEHKNIILNKFKNILSESFIFSPTGIGTVVEVEFTVYKKFLWLKFRKTIKFNITDYSEW